MLDAGADPNAYVLAEEGRPDSGRIPALYFACVSNNVPVVRLLLERGAAINDGESSYHSAQLNHRECLEALVAHGEDISHRHPRWTNTPLYFLAGHHDDQDGTAPWFLGFQWLLEHGADPNVTSYDKAETPLHAVAARPTLSAAVAEALIAHGADVNRPRADGRTPFALATRSGNIAVADLLRARGARTGDVSPLDVFMGACLRADAAAAHAMLTAHPDFAGELARNEDGATPLHWAAWRGIVGVVRLLVELGAPVNAREEEFGSSPLGWAAHGSANCRTADDDYCEVVELLIAAGGTVEASINKWNEGPQSMASPRVATLLEDRGWPKRPASD
jgi:ankyrin repeat protein